MREGVAMYLFHSLLAAASLLSPAMARAVPDKSAPLPAEVRLSEAEKERVLEAAAGKHEPVPIAADEPISEEDAAPPIHGEVGFSVGTGGYRSAYGTAIVPLKNDGVAIISVGSTDFGSRARHLEPWWQ